MRRTTGYKPDPVNHPRTPFRRLAERLRLGDTPPSVTIGQCDVLDQGQTSSCTGHAAAVAFVLALALSWIPSPAGIYRNGRSIDRSDVSVPITDDGAQPNEVFPA